ncbi:MAG: TolC family protein, partial [Aeromonas sp.]
MAGRITAIVVGIGLLTNVAVVQAAPLTFADAWRRVLEQDDGLAADRAGIDRAESLREAAKSLYLPKVDVGASYTHLDKPVELEMLDLNPIASHPQLAKALQPLLGATNLGAGDFVTPLTEQNVVTSSVKAVW